MLVIGEWAARRQADVLLYLGAFLLVVSALIFTSSRDEALSGGWRVAILAVYTAAFMAAGLLLRRWPRVREAGPVFLAIGALLMPLNFLLLYNEVLGDREVSGELVWFAASSYSMAFYGFLAARGLGRLYVIPAAIALLSAWGSLAIVVGLPFEWFGAWWMGFALAATIVLSVTRRWSMITAAPVAAIVVLSLFFSQVIAALSWADIEYRWQLPVTYALLTALVAVAGWSARQPLALLAVTVLAVLTALAGVWAAELPDRRSGSAHRHWWPWRCCSSAGLSGKAGVRRSRTAHGCSPPRGYWRRSSWPTHTFRVIAGARPPPSSRQPRSRRPLHGATAATASSLRTGICAPPLVCWSAWRSGGSRSDRC